VFGVFHALRWLVHTGAPWRYRPNDLPPWPVVYQQTRRGLDAGCCEAMTPDLRELLRWAAGRTLQPSAVRFDSATRQSTPESGQRAGYDGYDGSKRKKESKIHLAVDTLGHLLALVVTPANEKDRAQVAVLAEAVQEATGHTVEMSFVDRGYGGEPAEQDAAARGIRLEVITLPEAKQGFVLLPRRSVVARSFAWASRVRRLCDDDERLPNVVAGLHFVAFVSLMLHRLVHVVAPTSP
jgi:transposase